MTRSDPVHTAASATSSSISRPPSSTGRVQQIAANVRASAWTRRLAAVLLGVLILWALTYALVPWVLKSQIQKIALEKLGRQVTLGAVDFKPWSLEVVLTDLAVAKSAATAGAAGMTTQPATPQLSIQRVYLNAELQSLLRLAPVLNALEVDQPAVSLTHLGGGRYDIDDVLARLQPAADAPAGQPRIINDELAPCRIRKVAC